MLTLDEYQEAANTTAIYKSDLYPFLGLSEEAGEIVGKINKNLRKTGFSGIHTDQPMREALHKELGDVLWMLAACCTILDIPLSEVAQMNLEKLQGRRERGTLDGSGDDR